LTKPFQKESEHIRIEGVTKRIGDQHILKGIDLSVRHGEILAIIGASGTGKSVLLKHITGLMRPDAGRVIFDGEDISQMTEKSLAPIRRRIGMLFQNGALFDSLTVAENVAFPLLETGLRDSAQIEARVRENLQLVGLEAHLEKMPVSLSGGMRKRVALARAMINKPECLLCDEPTSGLDPIASDSINHLVRRLRSQFHVTSIVVTHDMTSAYHIADRIAFLKEGKVRFIGEPEEIRESKDADIQDFIHGRSGDTS